MLRAMHHQKEEIKAVPNCPCQGSSSYVPTVNFQNRNRRYGPNPNIRFSFKFWIMLFSLITVAGRAVGFSNPWILSYGPGHCSSARATKRTRHLGRGNQMYLDLRRRSLRNFQVPQYSLSTVCRLREPIFRSSDETTILKRQQYQYTPSRRSTSTKLFSCCGDLTLESKSEQTRAHSREYEHEHEHEHKHLPRLSRRNIASLLFFGISLLSDLYRKAKPGLGGSILMRNVHVGSSLLSLMLSFPVLLSKARRAIFQRRPRLNASCLMLAASLGSIALGDYAEAAAVASLFAVSETLEGRAISQSNQALAAIASDLGPGSVRLLEVKDTTDASGKDGGKFSSSSRTRLVSADEVMVGSYVSLPVGEKLVCDGKVVEGRSHVDETILTGETRPRKVVAGDTIMGGAINMGPEHMVLQTISLSSDSAVARLAQLVRDARKQPSQLETLVDRFAAWYVPPVFGLVTLLCTMPWALYGADVGRVWAKTGLVTLVAACPCPLVISTPVTYVSGLTHAARRGLLVKGGAVLEAMGKVKTVAMDKTGTLTQGKFSLENFEMTGRAAAAESKINKTEILEHLALAESFSSHPIANAVTDFVFQDEKLEFFLSAKHSVTEHTILEGEGLEAMIQGRAVHVGNVKLFERLGLYDKLLSKERELVTTWSDAGATVSFMSIEDLGIVCFFSVTDKLRPEASHVMNQLRSDLQVEVVMLTGDCKETAMTIGKRVHLSPEHIYSNVLPGQKLEIVKKLTKEAANNGGTVLMCGDGVNDAPALALANVGVAMGSGASLAIQTADVALTHPIHLQKLVTGIQLGRRLRRTLIQNFALSLGAKAAVVILAVSGCSTSFWVALVSDAVTMLLVTTNGLKLLPAAATDITVTDTV